MPRETARDHLCSRYAAVIAARARTTSRLTPRPSYKSFSGSTSVGDLPPSLDDQTAQDCRSASVEREPVRERKKCGSALKFGVIAAGEADLYRRFGTTMEWDTAAGQAILEAAGGRVETQAGPRSPTASPASRTKAFSPGGAALYVRRWCDAHHIPAAGLECPGYRRGFAF